VEGNSWYRADARHFFLQVIAGLWLLSVLGSCCNFLTLFYIGNDRDSSVTNVSLGVDSSFE